MHKIYSKSPEKFKSPQLELILDKIKHRKTSVKHFFRSPSALKSFKHKPGLLPPIAGLSKKNSKGNTVSYSCMEMYLASQPPKESKTTVKQLMKMTTNAKALVSSENLNYHQDKIIDLMKNRNYKTFFIN
jgi:hypothetical protein